jgi:hypothetical protein
MQTIENRPVAQLPNIRIFKRPATDDTIAVTQWEDKTWGELKDQPDIYQVLKTNIKLTVQLPDDILEELVQAGHTISTALVCETLDSRDYVFQNGIEMQKIQLRKNIVFIKVLINPISKLKKEADSFCQLPLYPQDRKAKARFWLRFYCGRYRPIDTNKFFLFIRRDELRSYKIEEGLPADDIPETPTRRELKKSTDSLRESTNSVQLSQPTTVEDDKSQTSEPKSPTSTPQSNPLRRSLGAKNKSLTKSRTPQTPQTPQARTTMWTPRTVLVPPNTASDPATSGSATPKLMPRPNFASAHLGGAFKPLTASAPGTLFPGHVEHSVAPVDDQQAINYSSHVITVTHSEASNNNSSQSTSPVPPTSSTNNVNISPRAYSVSPTATDTAPAARMYPVSLRASSPGLRAPTATTASPLVGRRALTSSGALIEMPPVFTNSNDRRNSSPIVFTPIQTISQPTSIDNTNPQHTTATYSLMVQQQIAEIEQQLITHQQQLRECQETVDKITLGDLTSLVNNTNAAVATTNNSVQNNAADSSTNNTNATSSDVTMDNEPMIECSDVDDVEMTDVTEQQQTNDTTNTTANETSTALPFPTVAVCKYNIYTDYSFVGNELAAYNDRFLLFVDEEIYASLPISDIWGSQRVLSGNPMSLEALKNNQERLMAKQDMPLICFVWLQGKRTDGSLFKVERCLKCQQNEVGKDFPTNPLRVYGTDLIRVHESKLNLRCKVIESSHHLEGSMFRVCIQLFDRVEQNGVNSLLQVTPQPLTSEWQRCIFSRTPKPVKEKEPPKQQPPPAQISEENLLLFSLMQKKAQQIQEITGLTATLTQLKRQRESMQSNLLVLHQRPDAVQICTQVLKPHLSVRMNKEFLPALTSGTGTLDIELIWSFQTEKFNYWKTIVIPNGLFYETTKPFFAESDVIKFKHVHLSNWTSIKNYIRDYLPKVYWKDKYLKANYGIRFNARVNNQITAYLEAPCLFSIDIRRENDPGYSKKKNSREKLNKSMDLNSQSAAGEDQESEPLSQ